MIETFTKIDDIAVEFGVELAEKTMGWFYDNKNPESPVQPEMGGGGNH